MESESRNGSLARGLHVVAVAAIVMRSDPQGGRRVLALRRAPDNRAGPGLWETLSGRVEHGEEPLDAARREIDEECGLAVEVEPRPFASYTATRRGLPMIVILYRAWYRSGEVRLSSEHDDHAWLTAEEFGARSTLTKLAYVVAEALNDPAAL